MRAKFQCEEVVDRGYQKEAKLTAKYSDSKEDNEFNEATPAGDLSITIDKKGAMDFLKPGKSYYLDFTEVPE